MVMFMKKETLRIEFESWMMLFTFHFGLNPCTLHAKLCKIVGERESFCFDKATGLIEGKLCIQINFTEQKNWQVWICFFYSHNG